MANTRKAAEGYRIIIAHQGNSTARPIDSGNRGHANGRRASRKKTGATAPYRSAERSERGSSPVRSRLAGTDGEEVTASAAVLGGGAAFLGQPPASKDTAKKNRRTKQAGGTEQKAMKHDYETGEDETDGTDKRGQRYYYTPRMETATARASAGGGRFRKPPSRGRRTTISGHQQASHLYAPHGNGERSEPKRRA